jgi:HD domain
MRADNGAFLSGLALVSSAASYAARRHVDQRRMGAKQEPYINHPADVANLLAQTLEQPNPQLLAAAWLHDVLEDTCPTREEFERTKAEIETQFGPAVLGIVLEVTDDQSLLEEARERLEIETTAGKSREARLLKVADKTSNVYAVAVSPPVGWDGGRVLDYVRWAQAVVASCRGLNAELEKAFDVAVSAAHASLLATDPTFDRLFANPRSDSE